MSTKKRNLLDRDDPVFSIPGRRARLFSSEAAMHPRLARLSALELNADMLPVWYYPLSTLNWAHAIWLIAKGELTGIPRINVIDVYKGVYVGTGTRKFELPSVVSHRQMRPMPKKVPLTRFNLLLRDAFTCQYTGKRLPANELNFDHVIPKSQGGKNSWSNLVTCDKRINQFKRNQTPAQAGLKLVRQPYEPAPRQLYEMGKSYPPDTLHESWQDYLYWDAKLEPQYTTLNGEE